MNDSFTQEMIPVRFTFQADRAHEFLDDGRLVTQMEFETVDEIIEITNEFRHRAEHHNCPRWRRIL